MIDLKARPFYLDDQAIEWIQMTMSEMSQEEKIGQLFCLISTTAQEAELLDIFHVMKPGGIMYRPCTTEEAVELTKVLQKLSKVPMLIASNLEKGGNGIVVEGTMVGSPATVAATADVDFARKLGLICAREGRAVGGNWAFAPIIDIDYNFRNPITNTRTFGNDPKRVAAMGRAYVEEVQKLGVAASIKHFPGDGVDERDQHLVTSINSLTCEEWDLTYGAVWRACIEAGALTAMIGHIMQPAWSRKLNPALKDEELLPASLSSELMNGLLREHLGFNGMIVTDATTMAGMTIPMPRSKAVPMSIAAGADMFLFTRNLEEDYAFMCQGVSDGVISKERLDEAVTRILATKAALGLHDAWSAPNLETARQVIGCEEHREWATECADKAVTLVKEEAGVLPISPKKTPRILYYPIEAEQGFAYSVKVGVCEQFRKMLEEEGFQVSVFTPFGGKEGKVQTEKDIIDNYDLILYCLNMATKSNQTTVRIEWQQPMGANCPHYITSIPTIAVSVENPYHLLDMPRVRTFINAYSSTEESLHAIMNKLTGRSEFKGKSPVDPFCGMWDTRL